MLTSINTHNPILPVQIHVPDSEAHVMPDGKLYIYGSFDDDEELYCSSRYHVVSTPDMKHWTVHDVSLRGEDVPWFNNPDAPKYGGGIDWTKPTPFMQAMIADMLAAQEAGGEDMMAKFEEAAQHKNPTPLLFAPDCIYRDGKYYLYFCMADDSEGVAVSDRPEGPFADPVQLPCGGIDPAIFVDEDGSAYYYWGQMRSRGVKLNPDMISFDPAEVKEDLVTEEEHCFHEGSSMRRIGDTYYYVFADMERGKPTSLGYATSKSPLGPFTYRGILVDNDGCDPESWNNHGSIECFNGQWYVFYHRSSGNGKIHRRLCIEKIHVNEDGSIDEAKMTSQGPGEPFGPGETIMGYQACGLTGTVYIGAADGKSLLEDHEERLTAISDGDTAVFRYVKSDAPWTKARVTLSGQGGIEIYLNGEKAGAIDASAGSGLRTLETAIACPAGEYELMLRFVQPKELEMADVTLF